MGGEFEKTTKTRGKKKKIMNGDGRGITDKYGKGFNMLHLNAAYDLLSHLYTDIIIQPLNQINEYQAMCDMISKCYLPTIGACHS